MSRERRQDAGQALADARKQLAEATENAQMIAIRDHADGVPEALIARELGVSRGTIRAWTQGG